MKPVSALYGVIGLLIGVIIAGAAAGYAVNNHNQGIMRMMGMHIIEPSPHTSMTMDDMVGSLRGKTGDDFDRAFITGMIEHHQGAIDMAKRAKSSAKHTEIRQMADDIVSAQSKEIDLMQSWQSDWGYKTMPQSHSDMMGH